MDGGGVTQSGIRAKSSRALVLTALGFEYAAVVAHLEGLRKESHPAGGTYAIGSFAADRHTWEVALAEIGEGTDRASALTTRFIDFIAPDIVLFVGIAGSLKPPPPDVEPVESDVALGDVVVGTKVYVYHGGKAGESFMPRPVSFPANFRLEDLAREVRRDASWRSRISGRQPPRTPIVHLKPIATGDVVVTSSGSDTYRLLHENYNDAVAVEMEGGAVHAATHCADDLPTLVIRGISDLLDGKAVADRAGWQQAAARHAAAFAFELLARLDCNQFLSRRDSREPPVPNIFNVPRAADDRPFMGRGSELDWIRNMLQAKPGVATIAQTQAITGLGGVGKSRLAREYALRHRSEYHVVWWVRAAEVTTRDTDMAALARALGLAHDEDDLPETLAALQSWLATNGSWLLIFDNAEAPDEVFHHLPIVASGHVLVTTRRGTDWEAVSRTLRLDTLARADAVALLVARSGDQDATAADGLAAELGDLPLALEQAAAYCRESRVSLVGYRSRFRKRAPEMLTEGRLIDYPATVATTWALSIREVQSASADAAVLLEACALLAPESIPRDLFNWWPENANLGLESPKFSDPLVVDRAVNVLVRYSLVEADESTIEIHRLVQEVTRSQLPQGRKDALVTALLETMGTAFPDARVSSQWARAIQLVPHVIAVLRWTRPLQNVSAARAALLVQLGPLEQIGFAQLAVDAVEEAVAIYRLLEVRNPGSQEEELAGALVNLTAVLAQLGRLESALKAVEEAVGLSRRLAEGNPRHLPSLAAALHNMGALRSDLAQYELSRDALIGAVAIRRQLVKHAPQRFETLLAASLNNLSSVSISLGDPQQALEGAVEAASLCRELIARDSDNTHRSRLALSLLNQASALAQLERHQEAVVAGVEAIQIYRELADGFPSAYSSRLGYALTTAAPVFALAGNITVGIAAAQEAVSVCREVAASPLLPHRVALANTLHICAVLLVADQQVSSGQELAREALELLRELYRERPALHAPRFTEVLEFYAYTLEAQGDRAGAESIRAEEATVRSAIESGST